MRVNQPLIALGALALMLASCGEPETITNTVSKTERKNVVLDDENIFESNKVMAFLQNETKFLEEANTFFLKGLNSFRNDKDLDSADHYLRQSIYKEPTAKAYFELGNVYMDKKSYDDAILAYGVAEQLGFEPFSKILYNKSCLYSLKKETELSGKYLEYALQAGYTNLDHINKDEDLKELRDSRHYKPALEKGVRGMSNADNLFWLQFKKLFDKKKMPHSLNNMMDQSNVSDLQYVSYEFEKYISEMRDEMFSREVSKGFYHYAQAYETENFVAVIYVVKDEFMGEYAPLTYRMATFTHEGKLIDKKDIGGRSNLDDNIMQATLNTNRTISIDVMSPIYEKDPDEEGYYDNKITSTEKIGEMEFTVTSSVKIKLTKGDMEMLASAE